MKKKIYKVGLVGAGHIANTFHMPAWERNKKSKIVSICDTNKKNLKKISQKYKIKSTFINYKKMLNKENLDLINICTPPHRHYKDIILACKFNKHILVEKPFVLRFSEAKKIANLLKNKKIKCMCSMHQRFRQISQETKNIIKKNKIGKVYYIKITKKQFRKIPLQSEVFSKKIQSGGGPLIDLGSHYFDLISWFVNFPKIKSVRAYNFNNISKNNNFMRKNLPFKNFDSEEFTAGTINFKNKLCVNFEMSYLLNIKKDITEIEIFGEKGCIVWPKGEILLRRKNGKIKREKIKIKQNVKASLSQVNHFINVVQKRQRQLVSIDESVYIVKLIENLYKSASLNKEINIE